jgi:hypothetical protein
MNWTTTTETDYEAAAIADALSKHPDCSYAETFNGMDWRFDRTWVVKLWRNKECYDAGDPPRHEIGGYPVR